MLVEKRNSEINLRPRFSIEVKKKKTTLIKTFENKFKENDCKFIGTISNDYIFIAIPKHKEHFWSPQLHLEIINLSSSKAKIKGLFGPKPQVWTLFMFVHFLVATMFFGFGVMAYVKYSLKENFVFPLTMLVVLPLVWFLLYFLGNLGKERGKKQIKELHQFFIEVIEN